MSMRVISSIDSTQKECFKIIVPMGIARETIESILNTKTPYKVNRPSRSEIEKIDKLFTISEAIEYIKSIKLTKTINRNKEIVEYELQDSLWFKAFDIFYCPENDITFFNCETEEGRKYCASELFFRCRDKNNHPNGNYYHYGEYALKKEPKGNLYVYNLYRVSRHKILEKSTVVLSR